MSAPTETLLARDMPIDLTTLTEAERAQLAQAMNAPQQTVRPRREGSIMGETAPEGWEFNPNYQAFYGGGINPLTSGSRYIPLDDYLRRFTTADPNRSNLVNPSSNLSYDKRAPDSPLLRQKIADQSNEEGMRRAQLKPILQQLLQRLSVQQARGSSGGLFSLLGFGGQPKPIQIAGIENIKPQRQAPSNLLQLLGRFNAR